MSLTIDFFIMLSQNKALNSAAKRWGLKLGAQSVVAGTNIEEMIESVKKLNAQGIEATVDNLGEFVSDRNEAIQAKEQILAVIEANREHEVSAHISLKPTQLGLDINYDFCLENLKEIIGKANQYNIFVNFDTEDYAHLQPTFDLIDALSKEYSNIGTVIQAYFYNAMDKGAYKEPKHLAFQDKQDIDVNFIKLIEYHLLNGKFTSIATHDHNVINHVKQFVKQHNIPRDKFEFQMLYGFRKDLQLQLVKEGYNFCTYVPFGHDWFGYFMRRLAERPQNLALIGKQIFNKKTNTAIGAGALALLLLRANKKRRHNRR